MTAYYRPDLQRWHFRAPPLWHARDGDPYCRTDHHAGTAWAPVGQHAGAYLARRAHPGPAAFPLAGPGWLTAIAVDGKAVRGAAGPDGLIPYLLATATHGTGAVLAERLIG